MLMAPREMRAVACGLCDSRQLSRKNFLTGTRGANMSAKRVLEFARTEDDFSDTSRVLPSTLNRLRHWGRPRKCPPERRRRLVGPPR
jgi:hypothetical protein